VRGPQIFSDASGLRKWLAIIATVALALAAIVLGSAFLFSFLEIPVNAPIAGLFGARRESGRNSEIAIPNGSVPVSPVLLDRYRKNELLVIDRADAARIKPPQADESAKVVIGFYASWQTAGLSSLRSNADKLTHLMPEWLQLNQAGDGLDLYEYDLTVAPQNVEVRQIAAKEGLQIWPILNNHDGTKFDPDRVHRLLAQKPAGQQKFAETLRDWLLQEGCAGINLDFESLKPADYNKLATFVPLLAKVLHAAHLSVSIDLEVGQLKAKWLPRSRPRAICSSSWPMISTARKTLRGRSRRSIGPPRCWSIRSRQSPLQARARHRRLRV
jgi:hypothetical protein